jgi:hypothetical protein
LAHPRTQWRGGRGHRCRPRQVEDQHVERVGGSDGAARPNDRELDVRVWETEDRSLFAEAVGELPDDRQAEEIAVEGDRLVVVQAGAGEPQGARTQMFRQDRLSGAASVDTVPPRMLNRSRA